MENHEMQASRPMPDSTRRIDNIISNLEQTMELDSRSADYLSEILARLEGPEAVPAMKVGEDSKGAQGYLGTLEGYLNHGQDRALYMEELIKRISSAI